jgi:hypothetical protein
LENDPRGIVRFADGVSETLDGVRGEPGALGEGLQALSLDGHPDGLSKLRQRHAKSHTSYLLTPSTHSGRARS